MDSPVIVDTASKFGREIDLDRSFPGFPFDDETDVFDRPRGDTIRAHLDDLAARHPELADHLRGPPWPFSGSLLRDRRNRRRGSGGSNNGQQHQVDEDARSQASGSSAASGASAVSSHSSGEGDLTSSSAIPQYGLRNTVDIGQQQRRRNMEVSPETSERGQRSMSAPPENRQQQQQQQHGQDQQQQPPSGQGQRFVSRVDITPQHNQQRAQSPSKPSNVRHIPIFVEGRDEPVMPKFATDDMPSSTFPHHQRQPSPPHFHRPSHFNEHFGRQQWPPSHFQNTFYDPGFEPQIRKHQQQYQQPHQQQYHQQQPQHHQQQSQHHQQQPQHHQQQPQHHQQQPQHHQQQQQAQQPQYQQQEQEISKPKPPPVPKDSLEKVAEVQKEVDNLAEQVRRYVGDSRQDKQYIYLDEMLTRELLKLDDIETEGRENVRQARKNTIKSIQDTISLLETKVPLADQQEQQSVMQEGEECSEEKNQQEEEISQVPMDVEQEKQSNEPISLSPAPLSPTKTKMESLENENTIIIESANQSVAPAFQQDTKIDEKNEQKIENRAEENTEQPNVASTDETTKLAEKTSDGKDDMTTQNKDTTPKQQTEETKEGKTESPRLQKKVKKTKKKEQQPVSEQAIPLPPPSTEGTK
ncbi:BAG domain-containing protein Samui-like isoform X2 [Cataglyphis hispanica]|uniref:BAG domain-containing protein Samui-like isoform X2 n=1 Tax=Cataglyphis hispanica TaxID=1086592 RepID=UPI0021801BEF|nr:BAG domain-containing protein Samui-like isoform X2 [Cataglyphis hispanica]